MKMVTCDKCGKQMPEVPPWAQVRLPILLISMLWSIDAKPRSIDLCKDCSAEFVRWLSQPLKEEDHV